MDTTYYLLTLIWLFPIAFIFHDLEEIIMVEKWLKQNEVKLYQLLPKKMADRIVKQFSMTTAQFSVAVLVIFLFVSTSTILAGQYIVDGPFGNIYLFTVVVQLVFFLHAFTHIGQSILLHSITPGVITSAIIIPYSSFLFLALFEYGIISWQTFGSPCRFCYLSFRCYFLHIGLGRRLDSDAW
ncbi:HXXEE domain-containing protein [Ureibacillus acetophenoni]|uniref:Uncharacterized protein with HXXEE motif n=1 Tax=Ureibacillus acetophenoni TaxID=614649 RepID=A0A285TYN2_9BACL|nr:HXXEE domain-containing protein [Ureibacillus acetophenoni]SOC34699.1 uncharacterized protein with HXXEE motif [Ureibacillus acetophenoni]